MVASGIAVDVSDPTGALSSASVAPSAPMSAWFASELGVDESPDGAALSLADVAASPEFGAPLSFEVSVDVLDEHPLATRSNNASASVLRIEVPPM